MFCPGAAARCVWIHAWEAAKGRAQRRACESEEQDPCQPLAPSLFPHKKWTRRPRPLLLSLMNNSRRTLIARELSEAPGRAIRVLSLLPGFDSIVDGIQRQPYPHTPTSTTPNTNHRIEKRVLCPPSISIRFDSDGLASRQPDPKRKRQGLEHQCMRPCVCIVRKSKCD